MHLSFHCVVLCANLTLLVNEYEIHSLLLSFEQRKNFNHDKYCVRTIIISAWVIHILWDNYYIVKTRNQLWCLGRLVQRRRCHKKLLNKSHWSRWILVCPAINQNYPKGPKNVAYYIGLLLLQTKERYHCYWLLTWCSMTCQLSVVIL